MSPREADDDGRIPFRVRIGVTGHRTIDESDARLRTAVREQIQRVVDRFSSSETLVRLGVVSQLADGADRIVVHEVKQVASERDHKAHLEFFLPLEREDYVESQEFGPESLAEFDELLGMATVQREAVGTRGDTVEGRTAAFAAAGRALVGRCDVLIALWDGRPSGGRGGTAETLLYAAARSKPCIWISTDGEPRARCNFGPGEAKGFFEDVARRAAPPSKIEWSPADPREALDPLLDAFSRLDEFNRQALDADPDVVLSDELVSDEPVPPWVGAPFVRATWLAHRWRRRFQWTARGITLLAAAAAVMLAIGLSFGKEREGWAWAEAAFFVVALLGLGLVRRHGFHRRWLSYRVLAERLRSAYFLAPTGTDFRRQAGLETIYAGGESTGWLMRAFEEVWDRRLVGSQPPSKPSESELAAVKDRLAKRWIGEQIAYHQRAIGRHRRAHLALASTVLFLFLATIAFACLHSLHMAEDAAVFFSIALPALGASLGVLLTVNQHQALSERSARMCSDLAVVQRDVLDATAGSLNHASSEAARVMAQETGTWFGSMWFLDIEHP